jgi:t-SNARE complex subunit (syntaxin)
MPIDRFRELQEQAKQASERDDLYTSETKVLHDKVEGIRLLQTQLQDYQLRHLADGGKGLARKIETTIEKINKESNATRNLIVQFGDRTQELLQHRMIGANEADIRKNIFETYARKLLEVTRSSWDLQNQHQAEMTTQVARRLRVRFQDGKTGTCTLPEEQLQQMAKQVVETGHEDDLFILAREELSKAMETNKKVRELERSMRELYQMFCDLNVLVVQQGERIDEVKVMVQRAHGNVVEGTRQIELAKKHQSKCCIVA